MKKGFTLIELLVVIAIIGLLSAIVLSSLSSARLKAQDTERIAVMNGIVTALELYYADNGDYPHMQTHTYQNGSNKVAFATALEPYIQIDLDDPIFGPSTTGVEFYYRSPSQDNWQSYGMSIRLLDPGNSDLERNDGGFLTWSYELGELPKYCFDKYDGSWWTFNSTLCAAGN